MEDIYEYCIESSSPEPGYLKALRRETFLKTLRPHMVSGPLQGKLLEFLVAFCRPTKILEIGTFTGYATLCMAAGLKGDGKIYSVEIEEELQYFHKKYFPQSGLQDRIEMIYGDANDFLRKTDLIFDFVFMDAGKKDYKNQLNLLLKRMKSGGIIIADNVLWKGKVLDKEPDKMTEHIHSFNQFVKKDTRVENLILPIRDGINVIRVK